MRLMFFPLFVYQQEQLSYHTLIRTSFYPQVGAYETFGLILRIIYCCHPPLSSALMIVLHLRSIELILFHYMKFFPLP